MTRCPCVYIYIHISIPSSMGEGEERTASGHLLLLEFRIGGFLAVIPVIKARSVIKEAREPFSRRGIYLVFCTQGWVLTDENRSAVLDHRSQRCFYALSIPTGRSSGLSSRSTHTHTHTHRVINAFHYCRSRAFCSCCFYA